MIFDIRRTRCGAPRLGRSVSGRSHGVFVRKREGQRKTIICARIKEVTGLNVSAGISYCKFLAKMASDFNKPSGQAVITPKSGPEFVANLPVKKFHGVGPATAARIERLGIVPSADLRAKSLEFLRVNFGNPAR